MRIILGIVLAVCINTVIHASNFSAENLTCEYVTNPLGIDAATPRFGWTIQSDKRDQRQTAYEIMVGSQDSGTSDNQWKSGKILSSQNFQIAYGGKPLKPFTRYFWRVRIYDGNDIPSEWSSRAWFETAMLSPDDWHAAWIGDGSKQFESDADFYYDDAMPLFRKEFSVKKKASKAILYIAGIGYHESYINGVKAGDHRLDPGWTSYKKEVQYVVHDITTSVKTGDNVVGVSLGNGWWNPLPLRLFGRYNLRDVQQTGRPCVKAEIHIYYDDGTSDIIKTDDSWTTQKGPVVRNSVYLGEHYDARLESGDWLKRGQTKKAWNHAVAVAGPSGALHVQMQPPIRVTSVIRPVKITMSKTGLYIVDMGQNFAGVVQIKVSGKAGSKVSIRYGEALHPDGSLNYLTTTAGHIKQMWNLNGGPGAPLTAIQEDTYILKGGVQETWSPRFTFHAFRFVEISGWPGKLTADDISGLRMNADLPAVGEFSCSNEMFNKIHRAAQWTFLSNVFSVQSDCPGREKMGYGADMVTTANAFLYNFDMSNFYTKSVQDFANDQQPDGGITEIAPYTGIADRGVGGESGPVGWQLAFPYLQKRLYDFYGDTRIIETNYDRLVKQIAFLQSKAINGLFHWDISDHIALDPRPEAFTASAFYYHHVKLAAEFAGILDKPADSIRFAKILQQIKRDIVAKYYVPHTGRFDNATQSAQLFALWYGLSPDKEKSLDVLRQEFKRHKMHVSSGIFGVMMMFDVLRENDLNDLAYEIANQKDFPGWGYMINHDATTLWESWDYPDNASSQNHPMFGSIDEWFYKSLLGINAAAPGFKKITIKPQPAGDLTWAKGTYKSIAGNIASDWTIKDGKFNLTISVPPNTEAEVWLPNPAGETITESDVVVDSSRRIKTENGYAVLKVGSGNYRFATTWKK